VMWIRHEVDHLNRDLVIPYYCRICDWGFAEWAVSSKGHLDFDLLGRKRETERIKERRMLDRIRKHFEECLSTSKTQCECSG
jgi:hypothetical protein